MSSAIHIKFKEPVKLEDFITFCESNDIVHSPRTIGGNIFYQGGLSGVEVKFGRSASNNELPETAKEISVSTSHVSVGGKPDPAVKLAKDILKRFNGPFEADDEFASLMINK